MQWIRLSNVISLHNIVVVREEGNEFLKIYRGPVFNCYVTLKPIFRMLMLHTRILNLNTLGLKNDTRYVPEGHRELVNKVQLIKAAARYFYF